MVGGREIGVVSVHRSVARTLRDVHPQEALVLFVLGFFLPFFWIIGAMVRMVSPRTE